MEGNTVFLEFLRAARLIGIVRGTDARAALATTLTLIEEGVGLVEVSLTTPGAPDVIARARAELGADAWIGAGTVVTAADADRAADAGASFIVTPAIGPGVGAALERGLPVVAGALTPTEVVSAALTGTSIIKLFPASLGGVRHLRALLDPFPTTAFVPVGGVDEQAAREYLAAGALAVGIGSPLVGDAASGGSLTQLRERARRFLAVVAEAS
jgi:2-dehydro-3-deoxyphosphogluconate aldolase/(4S)-4-hydroxy-2-oxoglutarate aldolase